MPSQSDGKYAGKSGGVGFPPTCLTPAGVLCMGLYDNVFEAHGTRYECTSGHFTLVMSMCYVKLEAAVCEASPEASDKICVLPSFDDAVYIAAALRVASLQGVWSASRRWLRLSRNCTISCSKDHSPLPVIQHMLALRYMRRARRAHCLHKLAQQRSNDQPTRCQRGLQLTLVTVSVKCGACGLTASAKQPLQCTGPSMELLSGCSSPARTGVWCGPQGPRCASYIMCVHKP